MMGTETFRGNLVPMHLDLDVLDLEWAIDAIGRRVTLGAAALTAYDPSSEPEGHGCAAALSLALAAAARHRRD